MLCRQKDEQGSDRLMVIAFLRKGKSNNWGLLLKMHLIGTEPLHY